MATNPADLEALAQLLNLGGLSGVGPGLGAAGAKLGKLGGSLLGSDVVRAILVWQIAGQVMGPLLLPAMTEEQQEAFKQFPTRVLDAATAADAFIRGHMSEAEARDHIRKAGFENDLATILFANAGNPPPPMTLLEMQRRGIIPERGSGRAAVSTDQGIREGRTHDKWIEPLKALLYALPSPSEALDALLEGQTDEATARQLWQQWGGHPDYFTLLFNTRGSAPTPMEAAEMARRGIIPWDGEGPAATSFHQAFLEGPWRNKWEAAFRQLAVYRPPVRSVLAMLRSGAIDEARATFLLRQQGADDQTISEILAEAHKGRTQTAKDTTKAEVIAAYRLRRIDQATAEQMLTTLGESAAAARFELANADAQLAQSQLNQAVSRTRSLFIAHKITADEARTALGRLGLPGPAIESDLGVWVLERRANVRLLTPAQIAHAVTAKYLSEDDALAELEALGYSPRDAWLVLAEATKAAPSRPMPAQTVSGDELSPAR